ncbi:MAG: cache domain-containing protein, partial [Rubrivivax sp.]
MKPLTVPSASRLRAGLSTLKFRLALASVLIIAVAVALAVQLALARVQQGTERALMDLELGNTERMSALLSNRIVSLQSALRAAADDASLRRSLAGGVPAETYLRERPVLSALFTGVGIVAPDGRILATAQGGSVAASGLSIADRPYFRQTLELQRPVVSEPLLSRVSNEPSLQFTMPVLDEGRTIAVLVASMRLTSRNLLDDLAQSGQTVKDPVTTLVFNSAGRILAHPARDSLMTQVESQPGAAEAVARWVQQGRPVEPVGDVVKATGHIVAFAGVPATDWVLMRIAREEELLGGVARASRESVQIAAGVALACGALVLALLGRMLRPLQRLQRRALMLGNKHLALDEGWPDTGGEIGQLSSVLREALRQRRLSDEQAALMLRKMHSVLTAAPIGIAFSRQQKLELVSQELAALLGWEVAELEGRPDRDIYAAHADYEALGVRVAAAFAAGLPFVDELQFRRRDGSLLWGRLQGRPVDPADSSAGTIWLLEDVTENRAERERLSWAASHDGLTRLANRGAFELRLHQLLLQGTTLLPAALLFVDLDRFKQINDRAGHAAGDRVLQ